MRFRLIVWVLLVLIVGLLAWQFYGAHQYPKRNDMSGVNRVVLAALAPACQV